MRVIAGTAKGRRLQTIEGDSTRPTTDRIKETLFNIIAFDLPECSFLDLFSGSGAIGIEALSRGAEEAVFVDDNARCAQIISDNLAHTRLEERAEILTLNVFAALDELERRGKGFDIVFLDPPYKAGLAEPVLEAISEKGLLRENGYIILERASKIPLIPVKGLCVLREKKYKTTVLSFLGEDRAEPSEG